MKDLGLLEYFLNIQFIKSNNGILISQRQYIERLLHDTGMDKCNPAKTPMSNPVNVQDDNPELFDKKLYEQILGKLNYISRISRPEATGSGLPSGPSGFT